MGSIAKNNLKSNRMEYEYIVIEDHLYKVENFNPSIGDECLGYEDKFNYSFGKCTEIIKEDGSFLIDGLFYYDIHTPPDRDWET